MVRVTVRNESETRSATVRVRNLQGNDLCGPESLRPGDSQWFALHDAGDTIQIREES